MQIVNENKPSWNNMGAFQKAALESKQWSADQRQRFLKEPLFWHSPKSQDVLRRQHSKLIDQILGFKIKEIEQHLINKARQVLPMGDYTVLGPKIHQGVQTWVGLDPETLQTPYSEILRILKILHPKKDEVVVDLGAAYGRMGLVLHFLNPQAYFVGIEYSPERVEEGQRVFNELNLNHLQMQQANLADPAFELPEADYYFIYDYGYHPHIEKTLVMLNNINQKRSFFLVVRGTAALGMVQRLFPHWDLSYKGKDEELFSIFKCEKKI